MARGDKILVVAQLSPTMSETYTMEALEMGDTVAFERQRSSGLVEVTRMGKTGKIKRTMSFRSDAVIAVIEEPVNPQ